MIKFIKVGASVSCDYPNWETSLEIKIIADVQIDKKRFKSGIGVLIDDNWLDSSWVHPLIKDSVEAID